MILNIKYKKKKRWTNEGVSQGVRVKPTTVAKHAAKSARVEH
jgi:hypothetical protein